MKNKEICMNCKYDMDCLCKNEFSEKYNEMVRCHDTCEQWEDEDGTNRTESKDKE